MRGYQGTVSIKRQDQDRNRPGRASETRLAKQDKMRLVLAQGETSTNQGE